MFVNIFIMEIKCAFLLFFIIIMVIMMFIIMIVIKTFGRDI